MNNPTCDAYLSLDRICGRECVSFFRIPRVEVFSLKIVYCRCAEHANGMDMHIQTGDLIEITMEDALVIQVHES